MGKKITLKLIFNQKETRDDFFSFQILDILFTIVFFVMKREKTNKETFLKIF